VDGAGAPGGVRGAWARPGERRDGIPVRRRPAPVDAALRDAGGDIHVIGEVGERIYVETWLPTRGPDGDLPPDRIPTILLMSPYGGLERLATRTLPGATGGEPVRGNGHRQAVEHFVPRGYAVAVGHMPGTGDSDGCFDWNGPADVRATERVLTYLGRDARWTNGAVGMYGFSADARAALAVAGLGDTEATQYLKAIVPGASDGGFYENWSAGDGVPYLLDSALNGPLSTPFITGFRNPREIGQGVRSYGCTSDVTTASAELALTGDYDDFHHDRDLRRGAARITAATLWFHGQDDWSIKPSAPLGFFDRIPTATPAVLIAGQWRHEWPDTARLPLTQFTSLVHAWFDRHLMGLDTGVDALPRVLTQDTRGGWHAERRWPDVDAAPAQLALSADGHLGSPTPSGTSRWSGLAGLLPDTGATRAWVDFTTAPLARDLRITGVPVLDAWVSAEGRAAHVSAELFVLEPDGDRMPMPWVAGIRSIEHRQPLPADYFTQRVRDPYQPGSLVRLPVRLSPVDVVVPAGHRLVLRTSTAHYRPFSYVGVQTPVPSQESFPWGGAATVAVSHDCPTATVLRFEVAPVDATPTTDPAGDRHPAAVPVAGPTTDPADVHRPVCGQPPLDPLRVTRGTPAA
jgi:X-Pro dipeptidyl-peptidase